MEQHDRETPVTPEQRALIEEAMRLAVEQTLMAGNSITKEHRLNACRAVERRLYGLPHLYARIRRGRSLCYHAGSAKRPAPLGLIRPEAWHGGFSPSIPAEISCQDPLIFALKGCETSRISFALNLT